MKTEIFSIAIRFTHLEISIVRPVFINQNSLLRRYDFSVLLDQKSLKKIILINESIFFLFWTNAV